MCEESCCEWFLALSGFQTITEWLDVGWNFEGGNSTNGDDSRKEKRAISVHFENREKIKVNRRRKNDSKECIKREWMNVEAVAGAERRFIPRGKSSYICGKYSLPTRMKIWCWGRSEILRASFWVRSRKECLNKPTLNTWLFPVSMQDWICEQGHTRSLIFVGGL